MPPATPVADPLPVLLANATAPASDATLVPLPASTVRVPLETVNAPVLRT
ncbi:MAG: hypothetical protein A4E73_00367 [Syntrophaceae bacterium PtaU1.Bin231]|nr:MAG: hypothetical protein A4E73_00367 [Syntrophaceae bacterium PtaU1.Bin231]